MSGGANKRREVLKFEGDDIDEYMEGIVNRVLQAAITILATPPTNIRRQVPQAALVSSLRKGVSAPFALYRHPESARAGRRSLELSHIIPYIIGRVADGARANGAVWLSTEKSERGRRILPPSHIPNSVSGGLTYPTTETHTVSRGDNRPV
eukprot:COSAG02_NODE_1593_length_11778_cov_25.088792_9_plen_150_part_01